MNLLPEHPDGARRFARIIVMGMVASVAGCRAPAQSSFAGVSPGMNEEEVVALLGPPSSRMQQPEDESRSAWHERWHWGDTLGTLATNAAMPDQPPPARLWTVWFDSKGTVLRVDSPHDTTRDTPWLPPSIPAR
jgi:hypothetical protein